MLTRRSLCKLIPLTALLAFGCAQTEPTPSSSASPSAAPVEPGAPPPAPRGAFKVGLITPGKITDKGWSQSANEGIQKIKAALGAELSPPVEGPAPAEFEGALRKMAEDGNQLIFLHASEMDDAAKNVAPSFPNTTFVVVGGRSTAPNLTPIQFSAGEATYLAGMLAAGMSKSGKIACVGGVEIPIVKNSFESFKKGAQAVKPAVDVRITFIGDGEDIAKGKQQTQALLGSGVDVVMHNANAAGQGVAQAVAEKPGALFIGANADQSSLATEKNLGSFIVDAPNAYLAVARDVQKGRGEGKPYQLGLKDRAVYFQYNRRFAGAIPPDLKSKIKRAEVDIIAGKTNPNP